jgi:hypothetical protein
VGQSRKSMLSEEKRRRKQGPVGHFYQLDRGRRKAVNVVLRRFRSAGVVGGR